MRIVILNGPNLNLLGRREPAIYGTRSMEQVLLDIQRAYPELHIAYHQSNHEGDLIDWVQEYGLLALGTEQWVDGIVLNAGGYFLDELPCNLLSVLHFDLVRPRLPDPHFVIGHIRSPVQA